MSERTPEHINFRRWLKETEFIPQRPKEAHLLAVTDKKTGKVCDIAITQHKLHLHQANRQQLPKTPAKGKAWSWNRIRSRPNTKHGYH